MQTVLTAGVDVRAQNQVCSTHSLKCHVRPKPRLHVLQDGDTALHIAAQSGSVQALEALMQSRADVNAISQVAHTCSHTADDVFRTGARH